MFKRFGAGFAVGYVFGARAGQKRYEQLSDLAERALDTPLGSQLAERARNVATADNGKRLLGQVIDRARQAGSSRDDDDDDDDGYDDVEESRYEDGDDDYEGDGQPDDRYDDEDAGDYDDEVEGDYDDEVEDRQPDGESDEAEDVEDDDEDGDDNRRPRPNHRPRQSAPRRSGGRVTALAAAARERGRVD